MDTDRPKKVFELTTDGRSLLYYIAGSLRAICKSMSKESFNVCKVDSGIEFKVASNLNGERSF